MFILWPRSTDRSMTSRRESAADYGSLTMFERVRDARGDWADYDGFGGCFYFFNLNWGEGCVLSLSLDVDDDSNTA